MATSINPRLYSPGGTAPTGAVALPDAPGLAAYQPNVAQSVMHQLRDRTAGVVAGAGILGAGAALLAARGNLGILARSASGLGGALLGAATVVAGGALLEQLTHRDDPRTAAMRAGRDTATTTVQGPEHLRVMTYNVHGSMGGPGETFSSPEKLDGLAAEIEREHPDVVLLQEVDRSNPRSGWTNVIAELADRLHPDGAVFDTHAPNGIGAEEGTAVLTFHGVQIADARGLQHSTPGGMPRATADTMLVTPKGTYVRALAGHYTGTHETTDTFGTQVAAVADQVDTWHGPTIWGADWNVHSSTPEGDQEAARLGRSGLTDAFTAVGIATDDPRRVSFGPGSPLDRIYTSDQFRVLDARVAAYPAGQPEPSDHHPVVVDLQLGARP